MTEVAKYSSGAGMRTIIQRIATGPELSKDLSFDEAREAMDLVLQNRVDPVQAGVFLIALRMKRETDDENRGVLQALMDATHYATAEVEDVVQIADPFDGFVRGLPVAAFLPPVLAACGLPCVSVGAESVGPKYGATHRKVLRAAGVDVDLTPQAAAQQVGDTRIGWAYVDQRHSCPALHDLVALRTLIVKRPCLTTAEVLPSPVRGQARTHLVTGYVHKPYPRIYALLAKHAGYDSAMLVRGVEGGVIPSLQQASKCVYFRGHGDVQEQRLDPGAIGIDAESRAVPLPDDLPAAVERADAIGSAVNADAVAEATAQAGLEALRGASGPTTDSLVYTSALCLHHLERAPSLTVAADQARAVLRSGQALARLEAASRP